MSAPFQLLFDLGLDDLNPIMAGEDDIPSSHRVYPMLFNSVVIHHVRHGSGTLYSRGAEHPVKAGQGFILLPGESASYRADHDDPWEYAWIGFTGKLAYRFSDLPPVFDLPAGALPNLRQLKQADESIGYLLAGDLFTLYAELLQPQYQERDFVQLIAEHIEKNYMQKLSVENFAQRFNMDRRYLSQQFKNRYGVSIRTYLTETRMTRAGELLRQGYSTRDASLMCGFGNTSNFHKMFTAHYNMTPLQWKQKDF